MATPTNYISQAKVGSTTYDIYALGLNNGGTFYSTQELLDMVTGAGFVPAVTTSLPAANASNYETYKNTIVFVGETSADGTNNSYDEYVIIKNGSNYSWEVVGHTGVQLAGLTTVSDSTGTPSTDKTGSAGSATINGSNFGFSGTAATITVPAHSHTIGSTTKYLTKSDVPATFSTTSVVASLKTENITPAGTATTVVTGYSNPTSADGLTSVSGTTTRYKTQSISVVGGTASVATAGTAQTVATEGITGYANPSKGGLETTSISYNTDAIKSYPGDFAALATTSIYPAANVTALTSVTAVTTSIYPVANITPVTGITLADISVTNGVLSFPQTKYGYTYSTTTARAAAVTVATGVNVPTGKSVRGTATTVATGGTAEGNQIMVGLGNAVAASKATTTVATGGTGDGDAFITDLGTPTAASTVSITPVGGSATVATKAADAITVITNGTTNSGGVAVITAVSGATKSFLTGLGTASTTSVATVGTAKAVVTSASTTANAYTGVATTTSVFSGVSTSTATGAQAFISAVSANTGEKAKEDISYTPAGSITGSTTIAAHTHSLSGHTHSIPSLSVTVPTT